MTDPKSARLGPLPADQWEDDAVQRALAPRLPEGRRNSHDAGNALSMLVHHPKLARVFLRFNVHLLYGSALPARLSASSSDSRVAAARRPIPAMRVTASTIA